MCGHNLSGHDIIGDQAIRTPYTCIYGDKHTSACKEIKFHRLTYLREARFACHRLGYLTLRFFSEMAIFISGIEILKK